MKKVATRDLQLMDLDGNVVRAMKSVRGYRLLSTSLDDLIVITDDSYNGPYVIDPVEGKVIANCPRHVEEIGRASCRERV